MQAVDDLGQRQRAHPRRRQLDRQRHPVQAPTDLGHGGGVVVGDGEVGPGQSGAVGEQLDGVVGQRQRGHLPHRFARHAERLAARGEHGQPRRGTEQGDDQLRARLEQVLAVVQHQQHLAVTKVPQQGVHRRATRLIGQPQARGPR